MTGLDVAAVALAVALLLSMPIFAVVSRGRAMDPEVARRGKTVFLGRWVRDWLMWVIGPAERAMVRAGVSPDALNVLGVVFGGAAGVAFARGTLSTAGWMIVLGGIADIFDGRIARARGIASHYGAFLDSTLDRFAETFAFFGVVLYFAGDPRMALLAAAALGGSLLVSYTRARGEALGVAVTGGLMQRAERLVLLAIAAIFDPVIASQFGWTAGRLLGYAVGVIAAGSLGTAVYRTIAIARALKAAR